MADRLAMVAAGLLLLSAGRCLLAGAALRRPTRTAAVDDATVLDVTVLVAVRSGDPLLAPTLARSATTVAPARMLLLVDDDDLEARRIAEALAADHHHVHPLVFGPPPPGHNPKVHKLAAALGEVAAVFAVLDDDTVLPPGGLGRLAAALGSADLVTAVPVYREQGGLWSRLVAAYVNGSALVTYLPLAQAGDPVSINGMAYLGRRETLEGLGGFGALVDATCDDYAMARLYRAHRRRIVQTAQYVEVSTTVGGFAAYARLMRRWMLFALQVLRRDLSVRLALMAALPTVLPLFAVVTAVLAWSPVAGVAVVLALGVDALGTWTLRRSAGAPATGLLGILLQPVAALLAPFQVVAAALGPQEVVWRGRRVRVGTGSAP